MTGEPVHEKPQRWSVRQRFIFIEQRIFWEGQLNRADLVKAFGISAPQASADIAAYMEEAPGNIEYDRNSKLYAPLPAFVPKYLVPDARKYLTQLLLMSDDALAPGESWLGLIPEHAAVVRMRRRLDEAVLQPIVQATHQRSSVQVVYQSMSSDKPTERWIAPHAMAFDGFRWHVRAWCYRRSRFVDFLLGRIQRITGQRDGTVDSSLDAAWQTLIVLKVAPNPALSPAQQRVIESDYEMTDGVLAVSMRLCMSYYFERYYCLDLENPEPTRVQIVLLNRAEVHAMRADLGGNA